MEKAHVAAGGPFCSASCRPKFLGVFTQFCPSPLQFLGFLNSFAHRHLKNWISVGDRITGFSHVCLEDIVDIV